MADTGQFNRVQPQDVDDRGGAFDGNTEEPDDVTPRTGSAELVPLWFQRGLVIVTATVVGVGGVGLLLAVLGIYHPALALVVGGLAMIVLTVMAWPAAASVSLAPSARGSVLAAIGMCVVAAASVVWNGHYAGHHVSIGRDPGVYSVTAKWLATHGNLEVHQGLEWTTKSPDVTVVFPGSYAEGANTTEFQFDHLTPVLLAEANNIGGDRLMFQMPAVLGALGLCAIFAAGCRVVRKPWLVLAAVIGLGVSLPQLNVTRDTFSEPSVQLLLWAGIWLLLNAYERGRPGVALLAGAALAGTMMSRIDAPVYLIPLPLLAALTWVSARSLAQRRMLARLYSLFLVGAVPVAVLATLDLQDRAGQYYDALNGQVHQLQRGLSASVIAGALVVVPWTFARPRVRPLMGWLKSGRDQLALLAGGVVGLALIGAWAIRPAVMHSHGVPNPLVGGLQRLAGLPVEPTRTYNELSVIWLSWYLGPVTIALATLGVAAMVARVVRRPEADYCLVLTIAGIGTGLYVWNPSITPDQIWAARRFVPAAMPFMVLLAAFAIAVLVESVWRPGWAVSPRPVLAIGAVALVAFPLDTTLPVKSFSPESGYLAAVERTCRATGPHAAILTAANDSGSDQLVGALQAWCDVPVATMTRPFSTAEVQHLAQQWRSDGRTLWIIGLTPEVVKASAPGTSPAFIAWISSPHELEMTINRPPQHYAPIKQTIYGARILS